MGSEIKRPRRDIPREAADHQEFWWSRGYVLEHTRHPGGGSAQATRQPGRSEGGRFPTAGRAWDGTASDRRLRCSSASRTWERSRLTLAAVAQATVPNRGYRPLSSAGICADCIHDGERHYGCAAGAGAVFRWLFVGDESGGQHHPWGVPGFWVSTAIIATFLPYLSSSVCRVDSPFRPSPQGPVSCTVRRQPVVASADAIVRFTAALLSGCRLGDSRCGNDPNKALLRCQGCAAQRSPGACWWGWAVLGPKQRRARQSTPYHPEIFDFQNKVAEQTATLNGAGGVEHTLRAFSLRLESVPYFPVGPAAASALFQNAAAEGIDELCEPWPHAGARGRPRS